MQRGMFPTLKAWLEQGEKQGELYKEIHVLRFGGQKRQQKILECELLTTDNSQTPSKIPLYVIHPRDQTSKLDQEHKKAQRGGSCFK